MTATSAFSSDILVENDIYQFGDRATTDGPAHIDTLFLLAVATVVIVLVFDYTNGFHDAANIVATVIASRAMTPAQAVIIVGVFEFLGPLLGGTAVANTIGKFVALDSIAPLLSLSILLCGLIGAIVWNLGTWYFGIPSSSSHALVGGLIGAVVVSVGADHVVWGFHELANGHLTGIVKVLAALLLSPLIGFWGATWFTGCSEGCSSPPNLRQTRDCVRCSSSPRPAWPFRMAPTTPKKAWVS